jgi:pimeloyl-ACP methyl ester carboxylesterase
LPTTTSNGITLTYETQGDPNRPSILLIMGLGMQLTSWPDILCQALADQGFHVIRFDNRDSGLSTKMAHLGRPNLILSYIRTILHLPVTAGYTLYDMANDAIAVLDALQIEQAHVVGASMGGMIAQIVAGNYPQRVLSLTSIMSTSGRRGLPGPTSAARRAILSRPSNPNDLESVVRHLTAALHVIGSPRYPTPEAVVRERIMRSVKRNVNPAGVIRQLMAIAASGDRVELLKKLQVPTLVIHGTSDPLVPVACGRDTARLVPAAQLREIEGMGHDFPPSLNDTIAQMIGAHCKKQASPETSYA